MPTIGTKDMDDDMGDTELVLAAEKCLLEEVRALVDAGADMEGADKCGNTALM